jgi:hypothetical protein
LHSLYPVRNAGWPIALFASRLHTSVGPFAQSVGPCTRVFAHSAGPHMLLFARPRFTVRTPRHLGGWTGAIPSGYPARNACGLTVCHRRQRDKLLPVARDHRSLIYLQPVKRVTSSESVAACSLPLISVHLLLEVLYSIFNLVVLKWYVFDSTPKT